MRIWKEMGCSSHLPGLQIGNQDGKEEDLGGCWGGSERKLTEEGIMKDALTEMWALWLQQLQKCDDHKVICTLLQADKGREGTEARKVTCAILSQLILGQVKCLLRRPDSLMS